MPTEFSSKSQHPLNPRVHLSFLDEFATRDLVDSHLYLLFNAFVVGKEPGHGLLHQIASRTAGPEGKLLELGFLILRQKHFHESKNSANLARLSHLSNSDHGVVSAALAFGAAPALRTCSKYCCT